MNSERIKEIQSKTAYPESHSVMSALMQVWNEVGQEYELGLVGAIHKEGCSLKDIPILYASCTCGLEHAKCRVTINPDNPRWKGFSCRPGVESPHNIDEWTYCPYCGKIIDSGLDNSK